MSSPVYDAKIRMDGGIIAEILGYFLKCNPQTENVIIPEFRISQLFDIIGTRGKDRGIVEGDVLEAAGCVYVLCLAHVYNGTFDITQLRKSVSLIEIILSETLVALELTNNCFIVNTSDLVMEMSQLDIDNSDRNLDVFLKANNLVKDILRDLIKQVRSSRTKGKKKQTAPIDCFKPHCIYFVCTLALCHIASVMSHANQLQSICSLYESILIVLHLDFQLKNKYALMTKRKSDMDMSRFHKCIEVSIELSYVTLKSISTITYLQQVGEMN
jgi:hypothetical protein